MNQPFQCVTVESFTISQGAVYLYTGGLPVGRKGHRYRVLGFCIDVPVNNQKVLMRCLSGPDQGLLFTVTPINFARRYAIEQPDPPPARLPEADAGPDRPGAGPQPRAGAATAGGGAGADAGAAVMPAARSGTA